MITGALAFLAASRTALQVEELKEEEEDEHVVRYGEEWDELWGVSERYGEVSHMI